MCKKEALATWRPKSQEKVTDNIDSRYCSLEANFSNNNHSTVRL